MIAVRARHVNVAYGDVTVVHDLSIELTPGRWLCLIGPNGAGKSTALRALAGLIPHTGEVLYDGEALSELGRRDVARRVAFVPQNPMLPMGMTVREYVLLGRTPFIPYLGTETAADLDVVDEVLQQMDLDGLERRPLGSLSGGEQQRAILGRALAQRAQVLLLDEPTTALDVGKQQDALELVDSLRATGRFTVISAMHDLTLAGHFVDRLVLLSGGRTVAAGPPRAVLTEATIELYYGASVRVIDDAGGISVIPTRSRRSQGIAEGA